MISFLAIGNENAWFECEINKTNSLAQVFFILFYFSKTNPNFNMINTQITISAKARKKNQMEEKSFENRFLETPHCFVYIVLHSNVIFNWRGLFSLFVLRFYNTKRL